MVDSIQVEVPFSIFFLDQSARLVITDIDGTITESNIRGLVYPQFGIDAHQVSGPFIDDVTQIWRFLDTLFSLLRFVIYEQSYSHIDRVRLNTLYKLQVNNFSVKMRI